MDNKQVNSGEGQLPSVNMQTPTVPPDVPQPGGGEVSVAQQAQQLLGDSTKSPSQITQQFVELKSKYLQSQGVKIGE
jgi:hypothetical protein